MQRQMKQMIREELHLGIIKQIEDKNVQLWNPVHIIPKPDGSLRRITDSRTLNKELVTSKFKMEDIQSLLTLVEQEDWACSIDIKSAYNHIQVSSELQPYLAFSVGKKTYTHIGMPFGISIAPRIFSKTLSPAIAKIRETSEVKIISYSDDILVLHQSKEYLRHQIQVIDQFLKSLGWVISEKKSRLNPSQEFIFLGWKINASRMEISLPKDKKGSLIYFLKQQIHNIYRNQWQTAKQVASMIGRVIHTTVQFQRGALHVKQINKEMNKIVKHKGWYGRVYLTTKCLAELEWWITQIYFNKPRKIVQWTQEAVIASDAALSGWGATLQINNMDPIRIFGKWYYLRPTSNQREISAIYLALKRFEATLQAMNIKCLKILSDNSTACFCLMRKRAAFSIHKQIDKILAMIEQNGWIIKVEHIKGLDNKEPDALSRLARAGDYQIKSDILMKVLQLWHISITLDAFASRRNAKHKRYYSIQNDNRALG
ncbi:MAG: putative Transposon Tf2-6 polyprotein [Streblomastix strix]|uniref:Putative Transposon Tf2-6 polyprotein n=1 Tax=Streblomastix strix TaxID=222440 RepID=A0A5J4WP53_9EUKA|nr:MAG: putative Transposon Tf2-6 polyprotein [Streblomastix strix]